VLAIYAKTPMDAFWKVEKRLYSRAPRPAQWALRQALLPLIWRAWPLGAAI
jgi:hypothetical protein